jgi:hypothetical protein
MAAAATAPPISAKVSHLLCCHLVRLLLLLLLLLAVVLVPAQAARSAPGS